MQPTTGHQPPLQIRLTPKPLDVGVGGSTWNSESAMGMAVPRVSLYFDRRSDSAYFWVDTGASFSQISEVEAAEQGVAEDTAVGLCLVSLITSVGVLQVPVRLGRMRVWWHPQKQGDPFDWPVLIHHGPKRVPAVLGLSALYNACRWTFDSGYSEECPDGALTLEDVRPV